VGHLRIFLAFAALGCGTTQAGADGGACTSAPPPDSADGGPPAEFVAYTANFNGFHEWSSAPATANVGAAEGIHATGPLQVYWNQSPPHGATSFPVGTIIVKETQETDVTQRQAFAMVKRGNGFNSGGANGWEWFSLQEADDGCVAVLWRGVAPLSTESYANEPVGDCNGCHVQATSNDSVWDVPLQLTSF
jgi:hypothetical protein